MIDPSSDTEVLTADERWHRWVQESRENHARYQRRSRAAFVAATLIGVSVAFGLFFAAG